MDISSYSEYISELTDVLYQNNILDEYKNSLLLEITNGFPESKLNKIEIYDYFAKILIQYINKDPIFGNIASKYQIMIYDIGIGKNYAELINTQYKYGLLGDNFYNFVCENHIELINMIDWERDYQIDYFGLKTLERSYLLKNPDGKFIERPQMLWLRTSIQIHGLHNFQKEKTTELELEFETEKETETEKEIISRKLELIKETYDYMSELYFTHATPTLFNSGGKFPQLSSCYLLQCPDDLSQIGDSFKSIMMISKWAGGIGINLSDIRSKDSIIKSNGGKTNGIIPLCKVLESLARYVNQSSKRQGSIATYLEVWHADIFDFIDLRKNTGDENLRARDLFLGLWVCDAFMRAVESDGDWYLMNPDESIGLTDCWGKDFDTLYQNYIDKKIYKKKIKATELYKKITESQFETGMPYMMFKDTINARSNQQNLGTIKNSNLCVGPNTYILTDNGNIRISELKDKYVNVWNGEKFSKVIVRQTGAHQKLIRIRFSNSTSLDCTPYHKFFISVNGEKKILRAHELKPNMKIYEFKIPLANRHNTNLYVVHDNIIITNVEDLEQYDNTFCFNEPEKNAGIFNGILTGNCTEIVEYSSADEIAVCNLASVSLPKFVIENEIGEKVFDFEKFGKVVQIITSNLNNIIDMNFYPVPQTAKSNLMHRPIGIGVQGLADCYCMMNYSFDSEQATKLNKQIFECAYWNSLKKSNDLAKIHGAYSSYANSPFSEGKLQFHLAGLSQIDVADSELNLNWNGLIDDIIKYGTRNSLLTTVMPTASTAQILNNNESIEPYASNMYVRKVLAGEYLIVNKHLVNDLKKFGMWNKQILTELQYDNGSVQKLSIPNELKLKYKTAYELKQSVIVKQAIDRGIFLDQSQSMNLFMTMPEYKKLAMAHLYAWKNGLKTGSYYIRSQPVSEATKFSIDIDDINLIKSKRNIKNSNSDIEQISNLNFKTYEVCETCSA